MIAPRDGSGVVIRLRNCEVISSYLNRKSMRVSFILQLCLASFVCLSQQLLVPPYIQPGNASALTREQKVVMWETDSVPGNFELTYQLEGEGKPKKARTSKIMLTLKGKTTYLYRATLPKLKFDKSYTYGLALNGKLIEEHSFVTRSKENHVRFATIGDFGSGSAQQAMIAYQLSLQKPQFLLSTGDNVYQDGLAEEYRKNLFRIYLAKENDPSKGAALMNTIPFYMVLGNHDVRSDDLDKFPDGLAYFYYTDLPLNAPITDRNCPVTGSPKAVEAFKKNASPRFPRISNFSFDYGNVHITCLDANHYANPLDPKLVEWISKDIQGSKAEWKLVAFHHPGFNSSTAHYDVQIMRLLCPIFESLKVDLVLTGHVHNYQRTVPLRFSPKKNEAGDQYVISPEGRVDGEFTLDREFDGVNDTTPNGIIYVVTGAGGASLYDMKLSEKEDLWTHDPKDNWVPFTVKLISHLHSFTMIETQGKKLTLQQIDLYGKVIDSITVTK